MMRADPSALNLHSSAPQALITSPYSLQVVERELARRSLSEFVRQGWSILEPRTRFIEGFHISAICEHLEAVSRNEIPQLIINIPPGHAKSLLCSVFWPAWEWIDAPHRRIISAAYAQSLSTRDSVKCRRLIQSEWYQRNWSDRFALTGDQNAKQRFENTKTGYRIATSVGGTGTGERGDRLIIDDPVSATDAQSATVREATNDWWDNTMSSRLNDPATSASVIVMQRLHEDDLSGHLLAQGGWEHLVLPAEYEGRKYVTVLGWEDPRRYEGELLWPDRFTRTYLDQQKRTLGPYHYAGQYQQAPAPEGGGLFRQEWLSYYLARPNSFDQVLQSWDCAFKDLSSSDYVVGQVWGRVGGDFYLLDQVRAQMSFTSTLQAIRNMSLKWPLARTKLIEDKANGTAVIDTLKRELPGIVPITPQGGKVARAYACQGYFEARNVHLPDPSLAPWVLDLQAELLKFPNAAHDDQVDALTQALIRLTTAPRMRIRTLGPGGAAELLPHSLPALPAPSRSGPHVGAV